MLGRREIEQLNPQIRWHDIRHGHLTEPWTEPMAGESYPQHSEGDTVESRAVCPCSAGRCLSALLSMLGHANFEITSPISGPQLCSFSSYDKILCSVNAPSFGFPFGSLTNPGNHHFPSNKLQVLQSAHGFNAAADRPSIHFPTQPIWTLTHDLPSLSRNTLIRQSMERKVGGDHS